MPDYISREAARDALYEADAITMNGVKILNNFPAADVVEVVRCRECRYWGGKYADNECSLITGLSNPDWWLKTEPNDFCSSADRKDGGQDDGT